MGSILLQNEMIRLAAITSVTTPIEHGNSNNAKFHLKSSFEVYGIAGTGGRRFMYGDIGSARSDFKMLMRALGWLDEFLETTTDPAFCPVMPSRLKPAGVIPIDRHGQPLKQAMCPFDTDKPCNCGTGPCDYLPKDAPQPPPNPGRYGFEEDEGD